MYNGNFLQILYIGTTKILLFERAFQDPSSSKESTDVGFPDFAQLGILLKITIVHNLIYRDANDNFRYTPYIV